MALAPIPVKTPIVDALGAMNIFFRQRWEELRSAVGAVPYRGVYSAPAPLSAALVSQLLYTAVVGGVYRVTFTARRTAADGVASTLTFTWHWTDGAVALSKAATVNSTDTTGDLYSETRTFPVDANTNLTFDMAYTSTGSNMRYKVAVFAELLTQG